MISTKLQKNHYPTQKKQKIQLIHHTQYQIQIQRHTHTQTHISLTIERYYTIYEHMNHMIANTNEYKSYNERIPHLGLSLPQQLSSLPNNM